MSAKRPLEGGGGGVSGPGGSPSRAPALKKRCRSFDLEIRGCRHLEELGSSLVQRLGIVLESAISRLPYLGVSPWEGADEVVPEVAKGEVPIPRAPKAAAKKSASAGSAATGLGASVNMLLKKKPAIPDVVTNVLTGFFNSARSPSFCRTLDDQNRPPRYKLRFMNGLSNEVFTKKVICMENGDLLKISLEEDNQQRNNSHHLLSAKIKFVVLHGDFNKDNKECWTSEDFRSHIVHPRDKVGAVLTGELELRLKNGEAYLRDATFIDNSTFTRSRKFRLGVMVVDELGERVQEGITEPFTVKDRRGEGSRKHAIPSLDDDVYRLKKISKDGVLHKALKNKSIFSVKDFLRLYNKDESELRKILTKAKKLVWTTIVGHAKMCDPGKELYSFFMEGQNVIMFFNNVYEIVGATSGDNYTPFIDLPKPTQDLLGRWSKVAYHKLTDRQPDYEMDNGKPRPITKGIFEGPSMLEPKLMQGHIEQQNFAERNVHEPDDQQGTSGSHSKQCMLKRLGSIRVTQNDDDAFVDISVFLDPECQQYCASTAANDITGSVTLNCPLTAENETTVSGLLKQASFTMGYEAYNIPFADSDASAPYFDASHCWDFEAL